MSYLSQFQRFCVLMLLLNGGIDRTQDDTNHFLKQLNVYTEIRNIKLTVDREQGKIDLDRVSILQRKYTTAKEFNSSSLQEFINRTVEYAISLQQQV